MNHKLPWETDGNIDGFTKVCVGPDKEAIGWMDFENPEDEARILHCVNAHAQLVEALKEARTYLASAKDLLEVKGIRVEIENSCLQRITAALAACGEGA